jgi:hypothetical protein
MALPRGAGNEGLPGVASPGYPNPDSLLAGCARRSTDVWPTVGRVRRADEVDDSFRVVPTENFLRTMWLACMRLVAGLYELP